jgi:glycine cleavage system H protein
MTDRNYPEELLYHPAHDWARVEDGLATFGITWYAQDAVGEVVFFDPPAVGAKLAKDQAYAEIESVKAVSEVVAPLSGEVVGVNASIEADPEIINADPYGAGWMVKVRLDAPAEVDQLLDVRRYREMLADA